MASKYGGIPVDDEPKSKYGGIPVDAARAPVAGIPASYNGGQPPGVPGPPTPAGLKEPDYNFFTSPTGLIRTGLGQAAHGVEQMAEPGSENKFAGGSKVIRGLGRATLPAAVPAIAANPIAAATGLVGGYLGGKAGEATAEHLGAGPEASEFAGDAAAIPAGMLGGAAGGLTERAAPGLMRMGLRIPSKFYERGLNPGKAMVEETSGLSPAATAKSGRAATEAITKNYENRIQSSATPADLGPARSVVGNEMTRAAGAGSHHEPGQLNPMLEQLTTPPKGFRGLTEPGAPIQVPSPILGPSGQPIMTAQAGPAEIARFQRPGDLLNQKRQFNEDFIQNWDKQNNTGAQLATARRVHGALADALENSAPGTRGLGERLQNLIPGVEAAEKTAAAPGVIPRIIGRMTARTGSMLPAVLGFEHGGIPGGAGVMAAQEALSAPSASIMAARALHRFGRPLTILPAAAVGENTR